MKNKTILEKADLEIADLTSDGGLLQPAQARRFIRHMIDEAVLMKEVKVVPMRSPKQLVEGTHLPNRIARPGVSAQALPLSDRSKPDLTKEELDAVLIKAQINLNDEVLEDQIEGGTLRNTVMEMMAEALARDIDELIVNGDTASGDNFLALQDGWLKLTTSHVTDAGTAPLTDTILRSMMKDIPSAALRARGRMRFYTSHDAEIDYRHALSQRGDSLGVMHHEDWRPVKYSGIPVVPVPLFPENLGAGTNSTNIILCDPKNWNHGIWRRIKLETQRDALAGVLHIVATLRIAGVWAHEDHCAKAINVLVA